MKKKPNNEAGKRAKNRFAGLDKLDKKDDDDSSNSGKEAAQ